MIDLLLNRVDGIAPLVSVAAHLPQANLIATRESPQIVAELEARKLPYQFAATPGSLIWLSSGSSSSGKLSQDSHAMRVRLMLDEADEVYRERDEMLPFDAVLTSTQEQAFLARRFTHAFVCPTAAEAADRLEKLAREHERAISYRNALRARNVIWICVDGVRPDRLNSCGNETRPRNYLDELLSRGALLPQVYSAGAGTHTAMHSVLTSMYPANHRMLGWTRDAMWRIHPRVLSLADLFKQQGYQTFRWCDCAGEQVVPKSGFDVWEHSDVPIGEGLALFGNDLASPRRKAFIEKFNATEGPKFAYIHMELFHELNGLMRDIWSTQGYDANLEPVSESLRGILDSIEYGPEDLLVLTTDHGAALDEDFAEIEREYGPRHTESAALTFASFTGQGIAPRRIDGLARSIDVAPTVFDLGTGGAMGAEGRSLLPVLLGGQHTPLWAFREKGAAFDHPPSPDASNLWCVRAEGWKLALHAYRADSNWLMDLDRDADYTVNQLGQGLAIETELRRALNETLIENPLEPQQIYAQRAQELHPADFSPEVSVLLPLLDDEAGHANPETCLRSLCAQAGPGFEILVLDASVHASGMKLVDEEFADDPRVRSWRLWSGDVCELLDRGLAFVRTPFTAVASSDTVYEEHFLSSLVAALRDEPASGLAHGDLHAVSSEGMLVRLSARDSFASTGGQPDSRILMFRTETVRALGGFVSNSGGLAGAKGIWSKLALEAPVAISARVCGATAAVVRGAVANPQSGPAVSLVVTATPLDSVDSLLDTFRAQTLGDFELIWVSPPGLAPPDFDARLRIVESHSAGAPAEAMQRALRAARGRAICWVEADAQYSPDAVEKLWLALEAHPECISVLGRADTAAGVPLTTSDHSLSRVLTQTPVFSSWMYRSLMHDRLGWLQVDLGTSAMHDFYVRVLERSPPLFVDERVVTCNASSATNPAVLSHALARRGFDLGLEQLYPWIGHCKDLERARVDACVDFGARLVRLGEGAANYASEFLKLALQLDDSSISAALNLAHVWVVQRRWQESAALLDQLRSLDHPEALARVALLKAAVEARDPCALAELEPIGIPATSELLDLAPR
ncbi:MAG: sulfatase-like hydrolase/transferase [bacterium]|nr:sulfatase-like hydrolase/transferase [bacterium]